jgi:hypothetical protein
MLVGKWQKRNMGKEKLNASNVEELAELFVSII